MKGAKKNTVSTQFQQRGGGEKSGKKKWKQAHPKSADRNKPPPGLTRELGTVHGARLLPARSPAPPAGASPAPRTLPPPPTSPVLRTPSGREGRGARGGRKRTARQRPSRRQAWEAGGAAQRPPVGFGGAPTVERMKRKETDDGGGRRTTAVKKKPRLVVSARLGWTTRVPTRIRYPLTDPFYYLYYWPILFDLKKNVAKKLL